MDEVNALVRNTISAITGDGDDIALLQAGNGAVQLLGYPDAVQVEVMCSLLMQRPPWWRRVTGRDATREAKIAALAELGFEPGPVAYFREIPTTELDWDGIAAVITEALHRVLDTDDATAISVETF